MRLTAVKASERKPNITSQVEALFPSLSLPLLLVATFFGYLLLVDVAGRPLEFDIVLLVVLVRSLRGWSLIPRVIVRLIAA